MNPERLTIHLPFVFHSHTKNILRVSVSSIFWGYSKKWWRTEKGAGCITKDVNYCYLMTQIPSLTKYLRVRTPISPQRGGLNGVCRQLHPPSTCPLHGSTLVAYLSPLQDKPCQVWGDLFEVVSSLAPSRDNPPRNRCSTAYPRPSTSTSVDP